MKLISINNVDYSTCSLKDAIDGLSLESRKKALESSKSGGIITVWQIAPSRNLSSEGTRITRPPTPAKTIRRKFNFMYF
jgi:hypothetical protein